jgi:hypothetical protein
LPNVVKNEQQDGDPANTGGEDAEEEDATDDCITGTRYTMVSSGDWQANGQSVKMCRYPAGNAQCSIFNFLVAGGKALVCRTY